jgi:hypothetical protein
MMKKSTVPHGRVNARFTIGCPSLSSPSVDDVDQVLRFRHAPEHGTDSHPQLNRVPSPLEAQLPDVGVGAPAVRSVEAHERLERERRAPTIPGPKQLGLEAKRDGVSRLYLRERRPRKRSGLQLDFAGHLLGIDSKRYDREQGADGQRHAVAAPALGRWGG